MLSSFNHRIKVFWLPKAQDADENDVDNEGANRSEYLASLRCSVIQGLPLEVSRDENLQSSFFADCAPIDNDEYHRENNTTVLPDVEQAHILLNFDHIEKGRMDLATMVQQDKENTKVTEQLKSRTQKLDDVVKSTQSYFFEEDRDSILETEVYAWGDNTCNSLVSSFCRSQIIIILVIINSHQRK